MLPSFPIYIVSKGRWESRLTSKTLEAMGVPYHIVVEEQEADNYRAVVNPKLCTVLILDRAYQRDYETCDDLGDTKGKGPGPARNFVWDHSIAQGHAWHWVMDDNINGFVRMNRNKRISVKDATVFRCMEDFIERYDNIAMAGPAYRFGVNTYGKYPPFLANTRIYSCNLIRNDAPFRWRGRYNEDTILSLDMLKAGWCTIQFYAFLQNKIVIQAMKGGNTDEFYAIEGTLAKSKMQVAVHPDVSKLVWRFNRWHHHVDYRRFKANQLKRRLDIEIPEGVNEYGMKLVKVGA